MNKFDSSARCYGRAPVCLPACLPGSSTLRIVQPHHPTTVPGNFTSCSRSLASAVILLNLLLRISPHTIWHIVATTPAQAYLFVHYMMPACMCMLCWVASVCPEIFYDIRQRTPKTLPNDNTALYIAGCWTVCCVLCVQCARELCNVLAIYVWLAIGRQAQYIQ